MLKRNLPFISLSLFCAFFYIGFSFAFGGRPLEYGEIIQFYNSHGTKTAEGTKLHIQGRVIDPSGNSTKRKLLIEALIDLMDLDKSEVESKIFHERASQFVADGEDNRLIHIEVAGQFIPLPVSENGGYFDAWVETSSTANPVVFSSVPSRVNTGRFPGTVYVSDETGFTVVSDIDDTIKITEVKNRKEMLRNTFVRPFRSVPGMAELYTNWKKQFGEQIQFHFLSGTPAQFYEPLVQFANENNFPAAAWHLRAMDNITELIGSPADFKIPKLRDLFHNFPKRKFILVGDSGERDPEIYAQMVKEFGNQVAAVYIRNITEEPQDAARYKELYPDLSRLKVFSNPSEIGPISLTANIAQTSH
jgi:phosphatidate phosphatase APP1